MQEINYMVKQNVKVAKTGKSGPVQVPDRIYQSNTLSLDRKENNTCWNAKELETGKADKIHEENRHLSRNLKNNNDPKTHIRQVPGNQRKHK
jgi:hypothetical protein